MTITMSRPAAPARGRRRLATAVDPVRPAGLRPASYQGRRRRPSALAAANPIFPLSVAAVALWALAGALAYALGLFT